MKLKALIASAVLAVVALCAAAEYRPEAWNLQAREKFAEQRYGVFIVWGLYAYYAQGECYMLQRKINRDAYERIVDGFYPSKFNAREWVRIVRRSGAKYITVTARHCDGFALWPSKVDDGYNIAATPFKRDVIGELAEACKAEGIQLNLYYSLMDWHRRDYPLGRSCKWLKAYAKDQKPDYASYKQYMLGQITELLDNYHPGNIWFDCEWDQYDRDRGGTFDWGFDEIFDLIHSRQVFVANNNHRAPRPKEDIQLFERDLPGVPLLDDRPAEQCDVIQYDVWGYRIGQNKFRPPEECIALIARAASKGSNLLLNIGPDASGQIPAKAVEIFEGIGKWFEKNGDSIYGTKAGGVSLGDKVVTTRKGDTLFIHFLDPSVKEFTFKLGDEIKTVKCPRPAGDAFDVVVRVPLGGKELAAIPALGGVKDEVHGYTPNGYVQPKEPEVRERLEWFKDQKLALMMCLGLYSDIGIKESWPLCDSKASWSRVEVDWTADVDEFKRQYFGLIRSFNPVRFRPETWAKAAKDNGFKYVLFTTKQHDGFCLYDTKYSSYKVTSPQCPFSTDKRADIVKHVFDAFRAEGLGIAAYFSKPDWYHTDFWENHGIGRKTTPFPTYDVKKHPEKWARFREFTRNQIVEIVRDYGKVDIIWLDGGQVQRRRGLDIGIEDIIAEARKYNPALIAVDRTAGGTCENVITPEQTVPKTPIAVPWESCITIGKYWGYHFEDEYKPVRQILHLLIDIVAKGGNLALDVGPQPDGRLPHQALERMTALGAWLKVNGEAIYETRPLAPYRKGDWAFTRNRRTGVEYAIRLWKEGEAGTGRQSIPGVTAAKLVHVGSGRVVAPRPLSPATGKSFNGAKAAIGVECELPADFKADANADVFRIVH